MRQNEKINKGLIDTNMSDEEWMKFREGANDLTEEAYK